MPYTQKPKPSTPKPKPVSSASESLACETAESAVEILLSFRVAGPQVLGPGVLGLRPQGLCLAVLKVERCRVRNLLIKAWL